MAADDPAQLSRVYHEALGLSPAERAAYLARTCGADTKLRQEVESLLAQASNSFLADGVAAMAAPMLTGEASVMTGRRIGGYMIGAPLGAGGMGEVYCARDTRLGRDVAVKILPRAFTSEPERLARFEREARVLASLNHPNIGAIYGLEESGGITALVMELVEGEDLSERIACGTMPIDAALPIAKQIADALETAHEQGIIHRDLKPANIKVRANGTVKVLDFGLAKVMDPAGGPSANAMNSPTITTPAMTQAGVILGTAAYMSPEQARGKAVDKRADIWAFGVVLYEMLTGRRAFEGNDVSITLAAVMTKEPEWDALPASTPEALRRLLIRCLQKDAKARMRDIGEARLQIDELLSSAPAFETTRPVTPRRRGTSWPLTMVTAVFAAIVAGIVVWTLRPPAPSVAGPVARVAVSLPAGVRLAELQFPAVALSPDGTQLAFAALKGSTRQLYIRSLDNVELKAIAGTEDATAPFFSPDGQWIGFFAGGKLKKISVAGSALQALWSAPLGVGGSWAPDNTIYFAPTAIAGLWKIPAAGGTAQPVTTLDRSKGEVSHRWPQVLPGGTSVLFTVWTGPGYDEKYFAVQSLETGERHVLLRGGETGRYVSTGHLVYTRGDALMAVPLDLARLKVTGGAPVVLAEMVWTGAQGAHYSVSDSGSLAYVPGDPPRYERRLVWVDRKGAVEPLPVPSRAFGSPQLSPDGHRLAVEVWEGTVGIWIYDFARATLTPLTSGGSSQQPAWTPDGERIAYRFTRSGLRNVFWKAVDGIGEEERLTTGDDNQTPGSWSPDGKWLAFADLATSTGADIWLVRPEGDRKAQVFLRTPSNERDPRFSPDGRWLAYVSDESGRQQICVRPFPGPGPMSQVSTDGGTEPVWSRDGRELFYLNGDKMMAVDVAARPAFTAGPPRLLYEGRYDTSVTFTSSYDVSLDGRRFLRAQPPESGPAATQIQVVINWGEELRQKVR
jgi:hypothetical protein